MLQRLQQPGFGPAVAAGDLNSSGFFVVPSKDSQEQVERTAEELLLSQSCLQ